MSSRAPRSISPHRGFTLIEIMAATGIMLVVILLTLTLTTNVLSSWTRSTAQLQTNHEARISLDLLTADLETMIVRDRGNAWIEVDYDNVGPSDDQKQMPVLYFFSPTLERPRTKGSGTSQEEILGDVCAICYKIKYQNPFLTDKTRGQAPPPIFALYRAVVDAENTFKSALSLGTYVQGTGNGYSLAELWAGSAYDTNGAPIGQLPYINEDGATGTVQLNTWVTDQSNFLSQNVADFKLIFWYKDSSGNYQKIDDGTPFVYAGNGLYTGTSYTQQPGAKLAYVDISLTVLSDEGAAALNGGSNYDDVIDQYGEVFTRRINIMSNPL